MVHACRSLSEYHGTASPALLSWYAFFTQHTCWYTPARCIRSLQALRHVRPWPVVGRPSVAPLPWRTLPAPCATGCGFRNQAWRSGPQAADLARSHFQGASNVTVVDDVPIDDGWTRDWGPSVRAPACTGPLYRAARCNACHRVETPELGNASALQKFAFLRRHAIREDGWACMQTYAQCIHMIANHTCTC